MPITMVCPLGFALMKRRSRHEGSSFLSSPRQRGEVKTSLPLYLGKVRHRAGGFADFVQKLQAVFAQRLVVDVDGDFFEEGIDEAPELGHRCHGGGEVFGTYKHRCLDFCTAYLGGE